MDKTIATIVATVIMSIASVAISDKFWYAALGIFVLTITAVYGFVLSRESANKSTQLVSRDAAPPNSFLSEALATINALERAELSKKRDLAQKSQALRSGDAQRQGLDKKDVTPIEYEALSVVRFLRDNAGISVTLNPRAKGALIATPLNYIVRLTETRMVRASQVSDDVLDATGRFLSESRGSGAPVSVRIVSAEALYLEYGREKPENHDYSNRPAKLPPLTAAIGDYWTGAQRHTATIDLADTDTVKVSGLICGGSSSGKSRLIKAALLGLFDNNTPQAFGVYINELKRDPKRDGYAAFGAMPHVLGVSDGIDDLLSLLRMVAGWCDHGKPADQPEIVLLLLDEIQNAFMHQERGAETVALLVKIMVTARSIGVRVWLSTQAPREERFPMQIKSDLHFVIACRLELDDYLKRVLKVDGASRIRKQRECIVRHAELYRSVTLYYLPTSMFLDEIERIAAKYPSVHQLTSRKAQATPASTGSGAVFPLGETRHLTDSEALSAYEMLNVTMAVSSKNQLYEVVFGSKSKGGKRTPIINDALMRGEKLYRKSKF